MSLKRNSGLWLAVGCVTMLLIAAIISIQPAAQAAPDSRIAARGEPLIWTDKANVTNHVDSFAAASDGTFLYAMGGDNFNGSSYVVLNNTQRYDPSTDSWTQLAAMPGAREQTGACAMNGKIYVPGGRDVSNIFGTMFIYSISTNTWSQGAVAPTLFDEAGIVCDPATNQVYAIGGGNPGGTNLFRIYNVASNTWSTGTPLPQPRSDSAAGLLPGGKIIVASGGVSNLLSRDVQIFDPGTNAWSTATQIGTARGRAAAGLGPDGRFYVAGGDGNGTPLASAEFYDLGTNTWTVTDNLNHAVKYLAGGFVGNGFYAVGGLAASANANCTGTSTFVCNYNQELIISGGPTPTATPASWVDETLEPIRTELSAAASDGQFLYLIGGITFNTTYTKTNALQRYSTAGNSWQQMQTMPFPISQSAACFMSGKIYVAGGFTNAGIVTDTMLIYDIATNSWTNGPHYGAGFKEANAGCDPLQSRVYVFGGTDESNIDLHNTRIFDAATQLWLADGANTPINRHAASVGLVQAHRIVVAGGISSGAATTALFVYHSDTNQWFTGVDAQTTASGYSAYGVAPDGRLYVAGGVGTSNAFLSRTEVFDINTGHWTTLSANLSHAINRPASGFVGSDFYAVGGTAASANTNCVGSSSFICNYTQELTVGLLATATPVPTGTSTPAPTSTATQTGTPTVTETPGGPTDTPTNTPTRTNTPLPTNTPTATETPGGPTDTPAPPTNTPAPTNTPTDTATNTPTVTGTPPTPTDTPTDCPNPFVDINGNLFYGAIHYLYCRGVVNGTDATHFGPAGTSTRAQFAKVVVLGFGLPLYTPTTGPDFTDVQSSYYAYVFIETGFHAGILSGFDAGTCQASGQIYPCYLPNRSITRGQLTKLVVNAAHYPLYTPASGQTFSDVGPSNVFFAAIETAHNKGVINGYSDNTFRPNQNITRDQMCQIVFKGITTP